MKILIYINLIKTIYFNFRMFPIMQALKMPVFIASHTKFISLNGIINIEGTVKTGMIRFGFSSVGIVDKRYTRTLIELNGEVVFKGSANFGYGSKISVLKSGTLIIGNRFSVSANSTIICADSITFGDDVLFSWEILVMDTDFHPTVKADTKEINYDLTNPIYLGNNTWVGTRCLILKGTKVPHNTIIGAGSLLNKTYEIEENTLLAGNPATPKKNNIYKYVKD